MKRLGLGGGGGGCWCGWCGVGGGVGGGGGLGCDRTSKESHMHQFVEEVDNLVFQLIFKESSNHGRSAHMPDCTGCHILTGTLK